MPNFFDKESYVLYQGNLQFYLTLGLKPEKKTSCVKLRLKPYVEFNTKNRSLKNGYKDGKTL